MKEEILTMILEELREMRLQIDTVIQSNNKIIEMQKYLDKTKANSNPLKKGNAEPLNLAIIDLPAALRKTVLALYKFEEATAEDLAKETNRLRAVESNSANQLVRIGLVKKRRKNRKVYFYLE